MRAYTLEKWLVLFVGALMVLTGCAQLLDPASTLALQGLNPASDILQLQRINGALLAVPGGLLLHSVLSGQAQRLVLLWLSIEKALYVAVCALALWQGHSGSLSLVTVVVDSLALVLLLDFRRRLGTPSAVAAGYDNRPAERADA